MSDRTVLAITYHPMLPSLSKIVTKHWKTMSNDKHALEIFPEPAMVAYRQPPNLKHTLCRAKLPDLKRPHCEKITLSFFKSKKVWLILNSFSNKI